MRRYLVDENLAALADRAATESAYRLGGAYRALRGVRPAGRRWAELATIAAVAGVIGAVAALTARRLVTRLGELIGAMETADSVPQEAGVDSGPDDPSELSPDEAQIDGPVGPPVGS